MTSYPSRSSSTTTTFTPRRNNLRSYWTQDKSLAWVSSRDRTLLAWRRSTNSPREWSPLPRKHKSAIRKAQEDMTRYYN